MSYETAVTAKASRFQRLGNAFVQPWRTTASGELRKVDISDRTWDYIYEPDARELLDGMMRRYIEAIVLQIVNENMASEQSARMVAMKAASDNAGKIIQELQLIYNKTRQAAITKELSEIVGGAAAV